MPKQLWLCIGVPTLLLALSVGIQGNLPIAVAITITNAFMGVGIYWLVYQPLWRLWRSLQQGNIFHDKFASSPDLKRIAQAFQHFHTQRLGYLLDAVPGMVAILNLQLQILQVNRRLAQFVGRDGESMGQQFISTYAELSFLHNSLERLVTSGNSYWSREITLNDTGQEQYLWIHAYRVEDRIILIGIDITPFKKAEEKWRRQSARDPLTGLANRIQFNASLAIALERAEAENLRLAILFVDLDRFRIINDSLGHIIGDLLLQAIAGILKQELKKVPLETVIARWGGDEFTILVLDVPSKEAVMTLAHRLITAVNQDIMAGGYNLHTTASIGIAFYPEDGEDNESLIKNADAALHFAKSYGRNNLQVYSQSMNMRSHQMLVLENGLHRAIAQNELVVYYQPKVNTFTGKLTGLEALIRWQHPELGLVMPNDFVPLAEDNGLVVPIGEWVLRTVCYQNRLWQDQGLPMIPIAVNLSARQFLQPNLLEMVERVLQQSAIPPQFLEIEITETLAMNDLESSRSILKSFYDMGIRITIDDFGTGYSALNSIKQFPVHSLKIDKSFIKDIIHDQYDRAIVQAIIALAHGLKLKVIAEGVENQAQLATLRSMHCTEIQGYLFSRPVPVDIITGIIRDSGTNLILRPLT